MSRTEIIRLRVTPDEKAALERNGGSTARIRACVPELATESVQRKPRAKLSEATVAEAVAKAMPPTKPRPAAPTTEIRQTAADRIRDYLQTKGKT